MEKLQNNFTTPEQSKRLLELGVPADSADCYSIKSRYGKDIYRPKILYDVTYSRLDRFANMFDYLPCWSLGRLIEIFDICNLYELHKFSTRDWSVNIRKLMRDYEVAAEENMLDFSKLEE